MHNDSCSNKALLWVNKLIKTICRRLKKKNRFITQGSSIEQELKTPRDKLPHASRPPSSHLKLRYKVQIPQIIQPQAKRTQKKQDKCFFFFYVIFPVKEVRNTRSDTRFHSADIHLGLTAGKCKAFQTMMHPVFVSFIF